MKRALTRAVHFSAASLFLCFAVLSAASGQGIQLTPAQQQMLNALPAAQRQQALDALRQVQAQQESQTLSSISESAENSPPLVDEQPTDSNRQPDGVLRAESATRLVIAFSAKEDLTPDEVLEVDQDLVRSRLKGSRSYVLDDDGVLSLQGIEGIPLLGLAEPDIERRLEAEPYLSHFDIEVRILDMTPSGVAALQPFGYDLFETRDASFDPSMTGPVPSDYVLGPGDTVRVQLFGNVNGIYEFDVTRDGILNLPELGPVTVAGIPFSEFRKDLNSRVEEMLIGTQVSVTMGPLRTIRVFVLGDANQPGSYVVGGLATMSSALYRSGGISEVGSLRNIQLKRNGRIVARLDLYELLLNGDTSGDVRLHPGDVIFVPPVGTTFGVAGAVKRPAYYEARNDGVSIADTVKLAGGLTSDAFAMGARLERIDGDRDRKVISIDLSDSVASARTIMDGDILMIPEVLPEFKDTVTVTGHVQRPGPHQWRRGLKLTDVIHSPAELKPGVDDQYVLIRRETVRGGPIQTLSADLGAALQNPASAENVELEARDFVYVFGLAYGRQRIIGPLIEELELQSTFENSFHKVEIAGNVRASGVYPLDPGMRVSDLIRAGGNLTERAYTLAAELTRYSVVDGGARQVELINVRLDDILRGDTSADVVLQAHDHLSITRVPEWESAWSVELDGEVKFPGTYRIRRGESLFSVLQRAGGLTEEAFPEGAIFLRDALRQREQEQIEQLARRLEADLTALSLQSIDTSGSEAMSTGQALLDQLRQTQAVGRLVIDTTRLAENSSGAGAELVELRDGDRLLVPQKSQVVTVIGETQQNSSHFYQAGLSRDDYISLSGGLTRRADKKLIYVVRANGAVVAASRSRWLGRSGSVEIRPGDTVVVPMDTDRIRPLTFWTNVTQILYQGAIAIAAVKTFGN